MNVLRITSPSEVVKYWDLFKEGLTHIVQLTGETIKSDEYFRMLINLSVRQEDAWIGIAMRGGPLSYGVCVDSTPPHSSRRTFSVVSFYAIPGRADATSDLMDAFESWAREQRVVSYIVTTKRDSGAIRCFGSRRHGFHRCHTAFEKHLT